MNPELRAVLTEALAGHQPENYGFNCSGCDWEPANPAVTDAAEFAAHQLDALDTAPGVAVIQLPEPDEHEDEEQEFTDFPGVGLYVPVVFDGHPGEVQIRAGAWCDEPLSVDEARGLAASILAAASYAEEAEE
ncbi:hypothetical protein PORCELAIN_79 [Mycobacterium phage Porcelain]|uniref:hypothetical protein n=1 Tax=Mycobacterium phage Ariel TaxID=1541824 RepID=UPI0004F81ABA|nr:hypothetical protein AVT17_gp079 [Mycobacterium phage Ariel]YP_009213297.1 hypothetical protein AVV70_gp080 [Mycobacterium phage MiaZeal]ASD50712.1 hypothetical protein PORCELAIN_79 [Mycobacterium phage Porcelain]ASZ74156.1 hypothetical protein SEA_SQUINT_80 [Mycobacterium phage Squint]AIM49956.1 hypothetical protein PBI_ARIEL_79 [Mycobacterium phage Ariel]AIY32434.1 hypothetical protein PBI_MIAZEAL_80 [Mycobacterium phage MiaZeal]